MILVVCLDDIMGMAFNGRRQSRDSLLTADLCAEAGSVPIYMHPRSLPLFANSDACAVSGEDFAERAGDGEYCFLEFSSPARYEHKSEKLIIYRWNRRYQSDVKFDIDLSRWMLETASSFPGSSHEKITKEVYSHE